MEKSKEQKTPENKHAVQLGELCTKCQVLMVKRVNSTGRTFIAVPQVLIEMRRELAQDTEHVAPEPVVQKERRKYKWSEKAKKRLRLSRAVKASWARRKASAAAKQLELSEENGKSHINGATEHEAVHAH